MPFWVKNGDVWVGAAKVRIILANARTRYTPASNAYCNAGDPADGANTSIGAVGCLPTLATADKFGRTLTP